MNKTIARFTIITQGQQVHAVASLTLRILYFSSRIFAPRVVVNLENRKAIMFASTPINADKVIRTNIEQGAYAPVQLRTGLEIGAIDCGAARVGERSDPAI